MSQEDEMRLPKLSFAVTYQASQSRTCTELPHALRQAKIVPADGCQRLVTENPGPAAAIAQHPNAGFTKFTATGICAIDATAAALDKCGFWACQNAQDATK